MILKFFIFVIIFIIFIFLFTIRKIFFIRNNKFITFTFSDSENIPSQNNNIIGYGGLNHNIEGYLKTLPNIACNFKRKAVYPPPWMCLDKRHNSNNIVSYNRTWKDYFDASKIKNVSFNPPFNFDKYGRIISKLNIKYYPSDFILNNKNYHKIDKNADIIVIVKYKNDKFNLYDHIIYKPYITKYFNNKFNVSPLIKYYSNKIFHHLNIKDFVFIHVRRGDFLDNIELAPPKGTRPYTSPSYIFNFYKKIKLPYNNIFIATNEKDKEYFSKLKKLFKNYNLIFESLYKEILPNFILKDNYLIYQISFAIANLSKINIITHSLKLGDSYEYRLADSL
tara:strand:+ start:321 stop:1328 length:1008 start_codon:yes stop_codon:yes gene_type:complete